jgi:hypothetical protein
MSLPASIGRSSPDISSRNSAKITPDSEVGPKRADKLLKVRLLDGTDQWL